MVSTFHRKLALALCAALIMWPGSAAFAQRSFDLNGGVGNDTTNVIPGANSNDYKNSTPNGNSTGTIAKQTCDTQVWSTMEARARLEMEREMMQNQNLIFKPDSVLNYACFDSFAGHASKNVGPIFTHNESKWGKLIIEWGSKGPGLDDSIQKAAVSAMKSYTDSNFNHALLGGRGSDESINLPKPATKDVGNRGSDYNCNNMAQVWAKAKCLNFLHSANFALNDGFFPFINLTAEAGGQSVEGYEGKTDVRKYPTACGGQPITGSTWKDMYRLSRNERDFGVPDRLYQYGTPLNKAFTEVRKLVEPGQCGKPVKTGVKVVRSATSTSTYDDAVCTNPGCTLSENGSECKK